jgi:Flp pilus assembly CpaE family ATPase|tara:strand:- start:1605 stop:1781 length:177 start_codon:yes stop_codon:yes gene_type:complete
MSKTFTEIKEQLSLLDEITVLETLEINSTELVERFEDKVEDKLDQIIEDLGENDNEFS